MDKKLEGAVQLAFAILIVTAVLYFSGDIENLKQYGYFGIFFITMLSSATLFFPAPGWATVIAMSAFLDPVIVGIVAGIGSGIGEMTGYVAGKGVETMFGDRIKQVNDIKKIVKKYGTPAIFVLSFIPNPLFDIAGIVAGGLKIPLWQFLTACILGRVIRYVLLALLGAFTIHLLG
ncbi:VTT domain-containing protein [Candidatus Micrarchaeota archaeon]|nr:VTT domain-containing protein [Candidatus Micrarchaeota archaeon]MBU1166458.1 VTT domain-containing protein [Candidatus Micrarchaeota archaeon]MBU1886535.1 VTT domain-containing protein [Candidatus Micrarchaeota archaeon]